MLTHTTTSHKNQRNALYNNYKLIIIDCRKVINISNNNRIFVARKIAGLTRNEVFEITNVPVRTLSDWETEKRKPAKYLEQMVIDKINRFALKKRIINGVKREVYFPELEKMDYLDGAEYLISNGYSKSNRYEAVDGDYILVSEYWKVTISEDDIDYDKSKDEEYNTSIIS